MGPPSVNVVATSKMIGAGTYGKVCYCVSADGRETALKSIPLDITPLAAARKEAEVMKSISPHPHIVEYLDSRETPAAFFILMEYFDGHDLLACMRKTGPFCESAAKVIFSQLMSAIHHIHSSGYVHRDIKLENILVSVQHNKVALADFGFATEWRPSRRLTEAIGSLHYSAPEVGSPLGYSGPEVDIWAAGVVLYALLHGRLPFLGQRTELRRAIQAGEMHPISSKISAAGRNLLLRMLTVDPRLRPSAADVLAHPWFDDTPASS